MPGFQNSLIFLLSASGASSMQGAHPSCLVFITDLGPRRWAGAREEGFLLTWMWLGIPTQDTLDHKYPLTDPFSDIYCKGLQVSQWSLMGTSHKGN